MLLIANIKVQVQGETDCLQVAVLEEHEVDQQGRVVLAASLQFEGCPGALEVPGAPWFRQSTESMLSSL